MFTNMKIAVKLGLSFGVVLTLLGIIVTVGISNMGNMSESTRFVVENRYAKVKITSDMVINASENGRLIRNLLLVDDDANLQSFKSEIQSNRDENMAMLNNGESSGYTTPKVSKKPENTKPDIQLSRVHSEFDVSKFERF